MIRHCSILSLLLLTQCTTPPVNQGRVSGIDPVPFNLMSSDAPGDPAAVRVPILRSATLEQRWGKPKLLVAADGSYHLRYVNPQRSFQALYIYGSPKSFAPAAGSPPPIAGETFDYTKHELVSVQRPQEWKTLTIAGKAVRYYVSQAETGADPVGLSTETFTLTAPDGRTGSYMLSADSDSDKPGLTHEDFFRSAGF